MKRAVKWILGLTVTAVVLATAVLLAVRLFESGVFNWSDSEVAAETDNGGSGRRSAAPAPVEVASVEFRRIEDRRMLSGTAEPIAAVTIAAKVSGTIVGLPVDISDTIEQGQVVAVLDSAEFEQAAMQAEAELKVAEASLTETRNSAEIAGRELERIRTLHERGIASDSQLDTARAQQLSSESAVAVAEAQLARAEAALQAARIRQSYTTIRARWEGGDDQRVVARRFAEEGDTIAANTPLLTIIELNPIQVVVYATERGYGLLAPGQQVSLRTDAFPGERWTGEIARVSPVFDEASRQARVEILVTNADGRLKPGMFVRVEAILGAEDDAVIVPAVAVTQRANQEVVFVVDETGETVRMVPVELGIRSGDRVQLVRGEVSGRVVVLGQQLVGDGSPITIPGDASEPVVEASVAGDSSAGSAADGTAPAVGQPAAEHTGRSGA